MRTPPTTAPVRKRARPKTLCLATATVKKRDSAVQTAQKKPEFETIRLHVSIIDVF